MSEAFTIKGALVGDYAIGKTHQLGYLVQAVGKENVAVVSCEKGLTTIASLIEPDNVKACASRDDLRAAYGWARDHFDASDKWVFMDGASRAMYWLFDEVLKPAEKVFEATVCGRTVGGSDRKYLRFLSDRNNLDMMRIYGQHGSDARVFWNTWLSGNWNLMATFLAKETKHDGYASKPPYGPDVPGRVGVDAVMGTFDFVLALDRDNRGNPTARTRGDREWLAKIRVDRFAGVEIPDVIENFNLAEFVATIRGEGNVS